MSRSSYSGPKLPKILLDQVHDSQGPRRGGSVSRKDRRKAERREKKSIRTRPPPRTIPKPHAQQAYSQTTRQPLQSKVQPPNHIARDDQQVGQDSDDDPEDEELDVDLKEDDFPSPDDDSDLSGLVSRRDERAGTPIVSQRAAKAGMAANDAEIAALERKLGMKSKRNDDELDYLLGGLGSESEEEESSLKRKRPEDTKWLRDKRLKATGTQPVESESEDEDDPSNEDDSQDLENPFSDDELSDGDFEGFSDEQDVPPPKKQRENPYVAPVTADASATTKYIPPSLRKASASDGELLKQLRRQIQGQLNRLSEANIISIVQTLEQIYDKNARQHVTSTLVDLLVTLVSDPSVLNDTFLILHAGFTAAVYKVVGTDFGAHLLERIVGVFDQHRSNPGSDGKQCLNLVAFLANLYAFQVVGSAIMFDYIRSLLDGISESNTELLLRVVRIAGRQFRSDDPSSLKDIVLLLQKNIASIGDGNLSVRTKFMVETINDLKNNRMKTGVAASAITAEHTTRIKKSIGSLNSRSVTTEPLRITLSDIRDSDKKGKWWLVGASFHDPAKLANAQTNKTKSPPPVQDDELGYESDTISHDALEKLARAQGMNTVVRRAIFMTVMSAVDYKDAHIRLLKLSLTAKQEQEIPPVLLHCAGAEPNYNPYYAVLANKLCEQKKMKKAFQFALWNVLGQLRQDRQPSEPGDPSDMSARKMINLAKVYGSLMADGGLSITVLKTLEFGERSSRPSMFAEVLLTALMAQVRKKGRDSFSERIRDIFLQTQAAPSMIQGLRYFVSTTMSKAELASGKSERKAVVKGCEVADEALAQAGEGAPVVEEDDDELD